MWIYLQTDLKHPTPDLWEKYQKCVSFSSCCAHSLGVAFAQMQAGVALPLTRAGSPRAGGGHGWREPGAPGWLLLDGKSVFTLMVTDLFSYMRQFSVYCFSSFTLFLLQLCLTLPFVLIPLRVFPCMVLKVGFQKGPQVEECEIWKCASRVSSQLI